MCVITKIQINRKNVMRCKKTKSKEVNIMSIGTPVCQTTAACTATTRSTRQTPSLTPPSWRTSARVKRHLCAERYQVLFDRNLRTLLTYIISPHRAWEGQDWDRVQIWSLLQWWRGTPGSQQHSATTCYLLREAMHQTRICAICCLDFKSGMCYFINAQRWKPFINL